MLERKYYENDNGFYSQKISISCFEAAIYESLRDYDVDSFLFFCNDINLEFVDKREKRIINVHDLHYNDEMFKYHCMTKEAAEAEQCIEEILKTGKIVVFRTAMDFLHTFVWYHPKEPYTRIYHRSIIIGCDENDFFYVDTPPTRNPHFFRAHPNNQAVGCIERKELLQAFELFCEVGYIEINESYIHAIADVEQISEGIIRNFYHINNQDSSSYIGKQALERFCITLKEEKKFNLDEFVFERLASRNIIFKKNLCTYTDIMQKTKGKQIIFALDVLANRWRIIRNLIIRDEISPKGDHNVQIAKIIEKDIIPFSEQLICDLDVSKIRDVTNSKLVQ